MNSITRKLVSCALCIALGVLLPMAFHVIPNAGSIFLPMHIPVLICGLFCGWPYGLACGILTPFISSVTTGMPPAMILPQMMVELALTGTDSQELLNIDDERFNISTTLLKIEEKVLEDQKKNNVIVKDNKFIGEEGYGEFVKRYKNNRYIVY